MPDFTLYMGISGNSLDLSYSGSFDIPRIISNVATSCVESLKTDPQFCQFGVPSMAQMDPVNDILNRINAIFGNLSAQQFYNPESEGIYNIVEFATTVPT